MGNSNMLEAKRNKKDEFYTKLIDVEKEINNYKSQFKNKIVYCNCDNPEHFKDLDFGSQFWNYFYLNFENLGLNKLIATYFKEKETVFKYEYDGVKITKTELKGNGDFRSEETIEFLKEADIVVTNPPFSLFRECVVQLIEYDKQFLIMGNNNAITYKEIFPLLKDEKMWLGYHANKTMEFALHPDYEKWDRIDEKGVKYGKVPAISWFTNLEVKRHKEPMKLYHSYKGNEDKYPKYDNYNAINVDRVNSIPKDYEGVMGVPITFLTKHTPLQFEIISIACGNSWANYKSVLESLSFDPTIKYGGGLGSGIVKGKAKYARILIKNKNPEVETNKELYR